MRYNSARRQAIGATNHREPEGFYSSSQKDLRQMVQVRVGDVLRLKAYLRSISYSSWSESINVLEWLGQLKLFDKRPRMNHLVTKLIDAEKGKPNDLKPFPEILCKPFWEMCGHRQVVRFLKKYVKDSET